MKQPSFLWKNSRGIYFFRARIPKQYIPYFNCFEIKKTLKTDSYRLGLKLARAYRVELDKEMEKLKNGVYGAFDVTLEGKVAIKHPDGSEEFVEGKIERNVASLDEVPPHKEHFLKQLHAEAERKEKQAREEALFQAQLANIKATPPDKAPNKKSQTRGILFSELFQKYTDQKVIDGEWKNDEKDPIRKQALSRFNVMKEIIGDKQTDELDEMDALKVEEALPNIPKNHSQGELSCKTIKEQIASDPATYPRFAKQTQSKCWKLFKSIVKFAKQKKYINEDITENCRGIRYSQKDVKANTWQKFTDDDLQKLFNGWPYQTNRKPRVSYHDYHFWLPLLGAYAGARINELCQLSLTDIKQYEGIWYFDITDEDEEGQKIKNKSVKTDAGKRKVPVHSKLIELGFLDFISQSRSGEYADMVFSSGISHTTASGFGKNASRWFNGFGEKPGYKHECGAADKEKDRKVFHSFRSSFASKLINHTRQEILAQLIGHEQEYKTTFIYAGEIDLPVLKENIEKLSYGIDSTHIDYNQFKKFKAAP